MPADRETPSSEKDPRVLFAIERTFLAWTRTALALMGLGFIVARLGLLLREFQAAGTATPPPPVGPSASLWLGTALVILGATVQALALVERHQLASKYRRGQSIESLPWPLATLLGIALVAMGLGLALYIVLL